MGGRVSQLYAKHIDLENIFILALMDQYGDQWENHKYTNLTSHNEKTANARSNWKQAIIEWNRAALNPGR